MYAEKRLRKQKQLKSNIFGIKFTQNRNENQIKRKKNMRRCPD